MVNKAINLILEDEEILELLRIQLDDDAEAALAWLKKHFRGVGREQLEGLSKPDTSRP